MTQDALGFGPATPAGIEHRKGLPYIWPTWMSGLISGDKNCWWAAWFKAHYRKYPKVEQDTDLAQWKANHAKMVGEVSAREAAEIQVNVSVEDQNKFTIKGKVALVGGKPDVVVAHPESDSVHIIDCKTGEVRDSDFWQVLIYMMMLTLKEARFHGYSVTGAVEYANGTVRKVDATSLENGRSTVLRVLHRVAGDVELPRTASFDECSRCDIGCCPDRVTVDPSETVTEEF